MINFALMKSFWLHALMKSLGKKLSPPNELMLKNTIFVLSKTINFNAF